MRPVVLLLTLLVLAGCAANGPVASTTDASTSGPPTSTSASTAPRAATTTQASSTTATTQPTFTATETGQDLGPAPAANTTLHYHASFDLTDTEVLAASRTATGSNCVQFTQAFTVVGGNVTLTWAPSNPTAQTLRLVAAEFGGATALDVAGPSPLQGTLANATTGGRWLIAAELASQGAVVDQAATLVVDLDYVGEAPDGTLAGCAIG